MDWLLKMQWHSMFFPEQSILEIVVRGTIMYLGMYALLRIFRRQAGSVGMADILVIVVIADAAQNGMAGESHSITEALILITTIVLWDFFLDWLGFKSTLAARFLTPNPLLLIKNGRVIRKNLEKEFMTDEDLNSQLREQGIEDISTIDECYLEGTGHFSVLTKSKVKRKQKSNETGPPAVN